MRDVLKLPGYVVGIDGHEHGRYVLTAAAADAAHQSDKVRAEISVRDGGWGRCSVLVLGCGCRGAGAGRDEDAIGIRTLLGNECEVSLQTS